MGLDDIRRAVKSGDLDVPAQFQDAADSLSSKAQRDEAIFPFLSWVLENGKPGARGAAMTLKAISQRKAWARDLLGKAYIDTENMQELVKRLAPEGYVGWQPREGRHLFTVKTIPEHVVDRLIAGLADQSAFGISKDEMHRALDTIKPQLVVGGDRYTMVIPQEVADTLDEFGDVHAEGIVSKIFAGVQSAWKRWVLINPRRFLKYNLNNQMGDLDAVIALFAAADATGAGAHSFENGAAVNRFQERIVLRQVARQLNGVALLSHIDDAATEDIGHAFHLFTLFANGT